MTATATLIPTGTYTVDPAHSRVGFAVKHLGIATVRGEFGAFDGGLELGEDAITAYGTVQAASVDTNEAQRDEHLRSGDFFDVERFPEIAFRSTAIRTVDEDTFEIAGDLTMHGITRAISSPPRSRAPRSTRGATSASRWRSPASSTAPTST